MATKNRILVFGEAGKGKSSVIKLVTDDESIITSDGAIGCTFECKTYETDHFIFIDTTGLGEGSQGTVPNATAIQQLIKFIKDNKDGFSLMVMVRKKDRITNIDENNYKLFYETLSEEKIPILLVITHCDFDEPIDQWWQKNKSHFLQGYKMNFKEGISVCAADKDVIEKIKPKLYKDILQVKKSSKINLIEAFHQFSLEAPVPLFSDNWYDPFKRVLRHVLNLCGITVDWLKTEFEKLLIKIGFSSHEAAQIADNIHEN